MSIIIKTRKTNFRFKRESYHRSVVTEHGILGRAAVPSELQLESMKQWNYVTGRLI
jgi:hypothetical protein